MANDAASAGESEPVRFLEIGRATAPHGLGGEFRVFVVTDFPDRFADLRSVRVGEKLREFAVESARVAGRQVVLKLRGVDDAAAAGALRGEAILVPLAEAVAAPADHYYWHQIVGLEVLTVEGESLGQVAEILRTGANDVYVLRGPRGELLLPAIEDVVKEIDLTAGRMVVAPLPGML